jgi:hypothetical protein
MDGIKTRIYCQECGAEVEITLGRRQITDPIMRLFQVFNLPNPSKEHAYEGERKCSCGKMVKATFVIEAFSDNERSRREFNISGGPR